MLQNTKKIISVTTESKFVSPDQIIMINKDQGRKEGIEISRVSPSDEPNPMGYPWVTHGLPMNKFISYNSGRSSTSKPDQIDNISLVTTEEKKFCHAQVITTIRAKGRKLGLGISSIFT